MILSDTDIVWHWHCLSSWKFWVLKVFWFHFFLRFNFFEISFFLICVLLWKKIKETLKNLSKRMYCCLRKQWLIHQQLLSYCTATGKIDKIFDFKAKTFDLEKRLFNSASQLFTQEYIILWIVCFFLIVKTVSLLK